MTRSATITAPDGRTATLHIPDGATADEIRVKALEVKARMSPGDAEDQSEFFGRLGEHYEGRRAEAGEIFRRHYEGEQGLGSTALQIIGKTGVGAFLDFTGEALITGGKQLVSALPDSIEDPLKKNIAKAGVALLNTDIGQMGLEAARRGGAAYQEWAEENPVHAANLESVVNIGVLVAPVKGKPGAAGKTGRQLEKSGIRKASRNKEQFIDELVTPKQTAAVKVEQVSRTTEQGINRAGKVTLTRAQRESAQELRRVGVKPNRSIQKNYEIISARVSKETDELVKTLRHTGKAGRVDKAPLLDDLADAVARIEANPAIVGSSKQAARKVVAQMRREIDDAGDHVADLLKARKRFDNQYITQGKGAILDPATENAMTFAVRETRRTVNGFIDKSVKNVGAKRSLQRQHRMLNAMDDIAVKAAAEANTAISRSFQKVLKVLTLRGELNQFAALVFGVGGLGAAAMFAPWILAGGVTAGIAYQGGKAVMSAQSRKALAWLLKYAEKTTVQGRLDRAVIMDLLETATDPVLEE